MEGLFVLISIFNYTFGILISYITGLDMSATLRVFAVFSLVFSLVEYQRSIGLGLPNHRNVVFKRMLLLYFLILAGMGITILSRQYVAEIMKTYLLSFGTKAFAGIFLGYALQNDELAKKTEKWLEPFFLFYAVAAFISVKRNSGGTLFTLGIDRQALSYIGAYAFVFFLYVNFNHNKLEHFKAFSNRLSFYSNFVLMAICIYVIIAGGGRGAFILAGAGLLYFLTKNASKLNLKNIAGTIAIILLIVIALVFMSKLPSISDGFNLIKKSFLNGFQDRSSNRRRVIWKKAYEYSKSTMFIGGGAGSTAYTLGFYSHNIFVDILAEFGILGVAFSVYVLTKTFFKAKKLAFFEKNVELMFLVFLCSFIMLLFSGSWYSDGILWTSVVAILAYDNKVIKENA